MDINIIIEPIYNTKNKNQKKLTDVKLPPIGVQIKAKMAFSLKMRIFLDSFEKHTIDINLRVRSSDYNTLYNTLKLKGKIKESLKNFKSLMEMLNVLIIKSLLWM